MADDVHFRALAPGDIDHVAANLCEGEMRTLLDVYGAGVRAKEKVLDAILLSESCLVAARDRGPALAIVGVVPQSQLSGVGCLWMVATEEAFKDTRTLVRAGRRHVQWLLGNYSRLVGRVDARNEGTVKWLRLLGFTVHEPVADGRVDYCHFEKNADVSAETA